MKTIQIGIIQQHNTSSGMDNKIRLAEKIEALAAQGAQLIVMQELHNSLYFCQTEDVNAFNLAEPIPGPSTELFGQLAARHHVVIVTSLFERRAAGLYHNTAVVIDSDGTIAGCYRKMHIPDDPSYYEKFYFTPGDIGFQPVTTSIGRLGVLVCWDQWYPEAARLMALRGADILIYPTAIGYEPSDSAEEQVRQRDAWITIQRGHAVANALPVVTVNRVGFEHAPDSADSQQPSSHTPAQGILFWGTSFIAGPQGELLFKASTTEETEAVIPVDLQRTETVRQWWPFLRDRRIDHYGALVQRFDEQQQTKK